MFKFAGNIIHHHVQGGQVFFGKLYRSVQVHLQSMLFVLVGMFVCFGIFIYLNYEPYYLSLLKAKIHADWLMLLNHPNDTVDFTLRRGTPYHVTAKHFLQSKLIQQEVGGVYQWFFSQLRYCLIIAGAVFSAVFLYFCFSGYVFTRKKHLSGNTEKQVKVIAKRLRKEKKASDIVIDGLPLVKNSETQHMGVIGTTGAGKSVLIKKIIRYARDNNQPAVIYDKTGELTAQFYDPKKGDHILNPFDNRMPVWDLWRDCRTAPEFDAMAANIINATKSDTFWSDGARIIFSALAREYGLRAKTPNIPEFLTLLYSDLTKLDLLVGTEASQLVNLKADKTLASFLSILTVSTKSLRFLPTSGSQFSIRDWVKNGQGCLFLTSRQDIHESVKSLFSSWINTAINSLMCLVPSPERRLWFFIDELPSLNAIPSIVSMLSEGRKFGACGVLGLQSIAQLEHLYGNAQRKTIASLLNTQFYFRQKDDMAEWASRNIGETIYLESQQSLSYGANTIRDGVNINKHEKTRRIATPDELSNLPDLLCYIRLAGNYPVAKHQLTIDDFPTICDPYDFNDQEVLSESKPRPAKVQPDVACSKTTGEIFTGNDSEPSTASSQDNKSALADNDIEYKKESTATVNPKENKKTGAGKNR